MGETDMPVDPPVNRLPARWAVAALLLALLSATVFWPATRCGFIWLDDDSYIFQNPFVLQGLTPTSLRWAFTAIHDAYWLPVTWLSYMVDAQLFGPGPRGFHLTNVALHAANVGLLFVFLARTTRNPRASALAAALFGLHPLRVEAVVWACQRKDTLCIFFGLLAMLAYLWHAKRPSPWRMLAVAVCLGLGLMAKPMLVTFPVVLLLLDWWPLGRLRVESFPGLVREKWPLFGLSVVFVGVTMLTHVDSGALVGMRTVPLGVRLMSAPVVCSTYIGKMFWPVELTLRYPPIEETSPIHALAALAALLAISAAAASCARRAPWFAVGWLWFLGTLAPVIGLVRVGQTNIADRFVYFPLAGLFVAIAWGLDALCRRFRRSHLMYAALAAALLLPCVPLTRWQIHFWRDSETLFRRAIAVAGDSHVIWNSLGRDLDTRGRMAEAEAAYRKSIELGPEFAQPLLNLGNLLARQNRFDDGLRCLDSALRLCPRDARARSDHGAILFSAGRRQEGLDEMRSALALDARLPDTYFNLGWALLQLGDRREALSNFLKAAQLNPRDHLSLFHAGLVLAETGARADAEDCLARAMRLEPQNPEYRRAWESARGGARP